MIGDKIKKLRLSQNLTQSAIAKKLGITRSSVNAWEMGISVPSTQYSDYLLDIPQNASISVTGLSEKEVAAVKEIVNCLKKNKI